VISPVPVFDPNLNVLIAALYLVVDYPNRQILARPYIRKLTDGTCDGDETGLKNRTELACLVV
jgi:hypothetical protein